MDLSLNCSLGQSSGNRLPSDYTARCGNGVDIGLSISEFWAACPVVHRTLYSADGTSFYDDATIIANIEASPYLNDGGELIGNSTKGYVQYPDGTSDDVLRRAYRYFGMQEMPTHPPYTGLLANYRSSDISAVDGSLLSTIGDHYKTSWEMTQATEANRPFFIANAIGDFPSIQFRENQILNLPAALSCGGRSISVLFISRNNHQGLNEKILAAPGGGTHWYYKIKKSPTVARIALSSSTEVTSNFPVSNQISLHGIGCSSAKRKFWKDAETSENAALAESSTLLGGTIGGGATSTFYCSMDMFECLIYDHLLSDSEYSELLAYANDTYQINYSTKTKQVLFHGNSLMAGYGVVGNGTIPNICSAALPANVKTCSLGQDGIKTWELTAAAATNIDNLYNAALAQNIAVLWEGRNDLASGATKEVALANIVALCQGRKAAGFQVVIGTIPPTGGVGAEFEVNRAYVNNAIRTTFVASGYADAVADVGADTVIGLTGQNTTPNYLADGTHLSYLGAAIAAPHFTSAISSLLM